MYVNLMFYLFDQSSLSPVLFGFSKMLVRLSISVRVRDLNLFKVIVNHVPAGTERYVDSNTVILGRPTFLKPHNIIHTLQELKYNNHHNTTIDTLNSNKLQSHIPTKIIPIHPTLQTYKTKNLNSIFYKNNDNAT